MTEPSGRPGMENAGGAGTILVVEDEDALRKIACRHLAGGGYNILEARTPEEAIGICGRYKEPIDLLLSDIVMPKMSGQELFRHIASLRPGIKIILMSGYISEALLESDEPFIQKPFTGAALVQTVRKVLGAPPNL